MKLNNAQKRQLKALGNPLKAVVSIGKDGIKEDLIMNLNQALKAHELVKVHLLKNTPITTNEAAIILSSESNSAIVSHVGRSILLYKPSEKQLIKLVK